MACKAACTCKPQTSPSPMHCPTSRQHTLSLPLLPSANLRHKHHLSIGTLEARGSRRRARRAERQATPGCRRRACIEASVLTSRLRNSCRKLLLDVWLEVREVLDVLLEVSVEVQSEAPWCSTCFYTFLFDIFDTRVNRHAAHANALDDLIIG
jgi:hypothetical protein